MKKMNMMTLLAYLGVIIIFILYFITKSVLSFVVGIICLIVGLVLYKFYRTQHINNIKDVNKRIENYNGLISTEKSGFQKALYLNQLSVCYNEKGENEKALQAVGAAKQLILANDDNSRIIIIGVPMLEICKLNEATYLIELKRFGEASQLLSDIDDTLIKDKSYLFSLDLARANLAIARGFSDIARIHLEKIKDVSALKKSNANILEFGVLFAQAKCDLLENDTGSAIPKLDRIINNSISPHAVELATELRKQAMSENNNI